MEQNREQEINRILSETGKLLKDLPAADTTYALDDILTEYGTGAAQPAPQAADAPTQEPPAEEAAAPEAEYVSVESVMEETVSSVMNAEAAARQAELAQAMKIRRRTQRKALRRARAAAAKQLIREVVSALPKRRPAEASEPEEYDEPSMDAAEFEEKRRCRRYRSAAWRCLLPCVLLVGITAAEVFAPLPEIWTQTPLRFGAMGGLLLTEALCAMPLWREATAALSKKRITCGIGAFLSVLACLGDCVWCILRGGELLPLGGAAGLLVLSCQWGQYLRSAGRRESFHLAKLGGEPPWGIRVTEAGAGRQGGSREGFYTKTVSADPAEKWQQTAGALLLCIATVLTGVVCLSGAPPAQPFWVWSALLAAAMPLSAPLACVYPFRLLSRRLSHSGCAVAGWHGARAVGSFRRLLVTDEDLFPAGTLSLDGIKLYGEEMRQALSYTVSLARLADSQALPMLEQLLSDERGHTEPVEQFRRYEEGGVGGSIHGETVLLGSAYFMRGQKVRLPRELQLETGLFLAVDGQLTAIFALKYRPSRNVDWALRALRRNRVTPVLAVRGCNITPGLLQRSFQVRLRPVYPDVETRLRLAALSRDTAPADALVYRDGLMPLAETVLGSRKFTAAVRRTLALATFAAAAGLLLCYYLTGIGGYASLTPLRLVLFQLLWAVPGFLLAGQVKHF